jgi:large subunit ribosomal protein L32
VDATTGEVHRPHHISPNGMYRGKKVIKTKADE